MTANRAAAQHQSVALAEIDGLLERLQPGTVAREICQRVRPMVEAGAWGDAAHWLTRLLRVVHTDESLAAAAVALGSCRMAAQRERLG